MSFQSEAFLRRVVWTGLITFFISGWISPRDDSYITDHQGKSSSDLLKRLFEGTRNIKL